jgi:hypothetical protein
MRGYVRCERCEWSRIYTRLSVGRLPTYCPACGRRVVREREPSQQSPTIAHWAMIAEQLGSERPPGRGGPQAPGP